MRRNCCEAEWITAQIREVTSLGRQPDAPSGFSRGLTWMRTSTSVWDQSPAFRNRAIHYATVDKTVVSGSAT